jgi:hypothetical protein
MDNRQKWNEIQRIPPTNPPLQNAKSATVQMQDNNAQRVRKVHRQNRPCKGCLTQNAKNTRSKLILHRPPRPNALETCKKIATVIEQRNQGSVELTLL